MKKVLSFIIIISLALTCTLIPHEKVYAAETTVTFTDNHEILHGNPYTGSAMDMNTRGYTFTNDPAITQLINGVTSIPSDVDVVRVHIAWSDFEPNDDGWTWGRLDQFFNKVSQQGKTCEIQLLMSENPDITEAAFPHIYPPAWLFDVRGCPYRMAPYGDGTYVTKQPLYYSDIYLNELQEAVNAFASRYDNSSAITWVAICAFSLFGEWSGWNDAEHFPWPDTKDAQGNIIKTGYQLQVETLRRILDIYKNAFSNIQILMQNAGAEVNLNDPNANTQAKRYVAFAFDHASANAGWGYQSCTVNSFFNWMDYSTTSEAQYINRKERRDHIQNSEGANWDHPTVMLNNPRKVIQNAIEDYHSNVQGINNTGIARWQDMKTAYGEWFTTLSRYVGYRFLMQKAIYNNKVKPGGNFTLSQTWTNNGVGFCPKQYPLKVYFVNQTNGSIAWSGTDTSFDQRKWFKGDFYDVNSSFTLPSGLAAGTYDLKVAMVDSGGNPRIALPMPNGSNKMYKIGTITVASTADSYTIPAKRCQLRVEAEDYTEKYGADARGVYYSPEGDHDSLYFVGDGVWTEYENVDVPVSGTYTVELRVSTEEANYIRLEVDGVNVTGSMKTPNSGGYLKFRTMERKVNLTAGRHKIKMVRETTNSSRWMFVNWMRFTLDNPQEFKIQAESCSSSADVLLGATEFTDGDGTVGVSCIDTNDWTQYNNVNVPVSGPYLFEMRYSTLDGSPAQKYKLYVDGVDVSGELTLYNSGGTNNMTYNDVVVNLTAGNHTFKVVWTDAASKVVWNWMKFSYQGSFTKTIETENYNMQWNIDKEDVWEGFLTGVGASGYLDNGTPAVGVGYCHKNDYMKYDNVYIPYTGHYLVRFRVSAAAVQHFRFEVDGDGTMVEVPNTGGNNNFITVEKWVKMSEGMHNFRIVIDDAPIGAGLCFNWFSLTK